MTLFCQKADDSSSAGWLAHPGAPLDLNGCLNYHTERAHQGIGNEIIDHPPQGKGEPVCQERLGGLPNLCRRAA
jgi:hypothetical protein